MDIFINPADARPIYVQIMDEIRRAIVLGVLQPDQPLPSVRQLAGDLRLNANTVAQAYRELEHAGEIYVRRGQGTFVSHRERNSKDRASLARGVAERAIVDAHRNGLTAKELVRAIRELAASRTSTPTHGHR